MSCTKEQYKKRKEMKVCVKCCEPLCVSSTVYCGKHLYQLDKIHGKYRKPSAYKSIEGEPLRLKQEWTLCQEDCFNCKYKDCIKP